MLWKEPSDLQMRHLQKPVNHNRSQLIIVKQLCFNFFRPRHRSEDFSRSRCKERGQKHDNRLHREQRSFVKKNQTPQLSRYQQK